MDSTHDMMHHHHHSFMANQADNSSEIMMRSYFHGGFGDQYLFECLVLDSKLKMWSVATLLLVISIAFEYVKFIRCVRCGCSPSRRFKCATVSDNVAIQDDLGPDSCYVGRFHTRKHRLIQTLLHTFQTTLGFVIMLSLMTFNLCLIFPIIVGKFNSTLHYLGDILRRGRALTLQHQSIFTNSGSAVGYYMFYRPYNEVESIESCH